jgi:hypothetical protein
MKPWLFIWFPVVLAVPVQAGYTNATLNVSAVGGRLSGGGYSSVGSLVPLGGQGSQSVSYCNYSGFAAGFILQPQTAFSGLPDEWNPDNDRDGLLDGDEIAVGSSLYDSDTDDDGLDDRGEIIAGTSPTDRSSVLSLSCEGLANGQKKLTWFGVLGRIYTFQYRNSLQTGNWQIYPPVILGTNAEIPVTDAGAVSSRFFRVKVRLAE